MSGASLDLERSLLDHTLAIAPMPALSRVYIALCHALPAPTEATTGAEVSGGGYARVPATFARVASPPTMAVNTATVEFPAATAAWGTLGYFEIWTAQTGGTRQYWGALVDPADSLVPLTLDVAAGDVARFSAGTLVVQATETPTPLGGPFLPLTGGTITGDLMVNPTGLGQLLVGMNHNYTITGRSAVWTNVNSAGSITDASTAFSSIMTAVTDSVDASGAQGGGMGIHRYGVNIAAGAQGGRTAFGVDMRQVGATTLAPQMYYVGGSFFVQAGFSAGGAAGAGNQRGTLFASNDSVRLVAGAGSFWNGLCGYELNIGAEAGTGVVRKQGMKIVTWATDRVAGSAGSDYAYSMAAQDICAGWDVGYAIGSPDGWWPMKPAGTLIGTVAPFAGGPAYAAAWGIDFTQVAFSGGLIRGPGFSVSGAGATQIGGGANNALTISPGPAAANNVTFTASGTGVFQFRSALQIGVPANNLLLLTPGATSTDPISISQGGTGGINLVTTRITGSVGFNNTAPIAKPTVSGSRAGNAALASLLTALAAYGLITDSSTA